MGGLGTVISNGGAQGQLVRIVKIESDTFPSSVSVGDLVNYASGTGSRGGLYVVTYDTAKKTFHLGASQSTAQASLAKDGTTLTPKSVGSYPLTLGGKWRLVASSNAPAVGTTPDYQPSSYFPEGTYNCAIIFPATSGNDYDVDFLAWQDDSPGSGF